ncbi:MAG: OpgC domain-containing protein [Alphaproteobacteria bacterium]
MVPDKTFLSVPLMLHFLALTHVVAVLTAGSRWLASATARPLVVIGQQALPVFCVGSVLAILAQVIRFEVEGGLLVDSMLIGCGILAQFFLAEYLQWRKTGERRAAAGVIAVR